MEKRITILFTCGQLKEVEDALDMMKVFWERVQDREKMNKIEEALAEIKRQRAEAAMKEVI